MIVNMPIEIPDWTEWLAIEPHGAIFVYSQKPRISINADGWKKRSRRSKQIFICYSDIPKDWKKALYQIIDGELVRGG